MRSIFVVVASMSIASCAAQYDVPYAEEQVGTIRNDAASHPINTTTSSDDGGSLSVDLSVYGSHLDLSPISGATAITASTFVCSSGGKTCRLSNELEAFAFNKQTGETFSDNYFARQYIDGVEILPGTIKYNDPRVGCYCTRQSFVAPSVGECESIDSEDFVVLDRMLPAIDSVTKKITVMATCKDWQTLSACTKTKCEEVGKTHARAVPQVDSVVYGIDQYNTDFGLSFTHYTCECY